MLQQFLLVAGAHFLALLSPGPDFFLILRYAVAHDRRRAAWACVGIALANALYVLLALFGLMALDDGGGAFLAIQWAGCGFLLFMGWQFVRHAGRQTGPGTGDTATLGGTSCGPLLAGLASGLLNPKNGLFYASLFAALGARATPFAIQGLYAAWMIAVVLGWDLLVVRLASRPALMHRFGRGLRHIERLAGIALLLLALGLAASLLDRWP